MICYGNKYPTRICTFKNMRYTKHQLPQVMVALVVTRQDYGNAVLTGLPVYLSRRLQSALNAAAR